MPDHGEPGSDRVAAVLSYVVISAVNLAEVASELNELGADADTARALLAASIFLSARKRPPKAKISQAGSAAARPRTMPCP